MLGEVAYRRTKEDQSNLGAITSWLRIGELKAEQRECPNYNKGKFQKAAKEIRKLTSSRVFADASIVSSSCGIRLSAINSEGARQR